jgi:hypothetical protein
VTDQLAQLPVDGSRVIRKLTAHVADLTERNVVLETLLEQAQERCVDQERMLEQMRAERENEPT